MLTLQNSTPKMFNLIELSFLIFFLHFVTADDPAECSMQNALMSSKGEAFGATQKLTWKVECFSATSPMLRVTLMDSDNVTSQKQPGWIGFGVNNVTQMIGSFIVTCEWQDGKLNIKQRYSGAKSKENRPAETSWGVQPCMQTSNIGMCQFVIPAQIQATADGSDRKLNLTATGTTPAVVMARGPIGPDGIQYHTARTADQLNMMAKS